MHNKSKIITISAKDNNADFYISNVNVDKENFEINFIFLKDKYNLKISKPLPRYYAYSFLITNRSKTL